MKIHLKLSKTKEYILACSFGPDTMCLFNILLNNGFNFVVAHVNYHLRKEEAGEMKIFKKLCIKNHIKLFIKDVYMPEKVNEEDWARKIRYDYFQEIAKKIDVFNILIAHNQDDLIETYLLQKKRNNIVSFYGLKNKYKLGETFIIRPLLNYKKKSLQNYCDEFNVPYGLDLSNFDTSYARNKIRKEIVSNMSDNKREEILYEIKNRNIKQAIKIKKLDCFSKSKTIKVSDIINLSIEDFQLSLILYFEKKNIYYPISRGFVSEFLKIIKSKSTWHKQLNQSVYFCLDYGEIALYKIMLRNYCEKPDNKLFKVNRKSNLYSIISEKEYVIRNGLKSNEVFELNGLKKKIGRCFIDWKIPYVYRLVWPGIYTNDGKLLYVPHYKKNYVLNKNSLLCFNLRDFIK